MPFDTLNGRLKEVAVKSMIFCKTKYGASGLRQETGIADSISWRPTFFLKPSKFSIIAVEVEDNLYPESLKGAAQDILHYDFPVSVYQACSLEAYQTDPKQSKITQLRNHGFGIITVDADGNAIVQHLCGPLAQNISPIQFESSIKNLKNVVKIPFRAAYDTYKTNEGQGLQQAGQIVEGLISSLASEAEKKGVITRSVLSGALGDQIDALYSTTIFKPHRAALGGVRDFVKEYRNTASHAPKTAKEAADRIKMCRKGFLESIDLATKLGIVTKALGYKTKVFMI
jgi:hypothetical protein